MRTLAVACVVYAVASAASAGQVASAPPQTTPLFRASVTHVLVDVVVTGNDGSPITDLRQHVLVDVVVTGNDGSPITDLRQSEFDISDNGRPQKIEDFEQVSIPIARRTVDVDAPSQPPSDVASNGESARASRALVIFVDDPSLSAVLFCDTCPDVMVALEEALTRFLRSLTPDDQVALVW